MENKPYGVIYKITNLINNKIYIGQTINPDKRWKRHKSNSKQNSKKDCGMAITLSMKRYGYENFSFKIIDSASCQEELNKLEEFYILELRSLSPNGYNLKSYSEGVGKMSSESRNKCSISTMNKKSKNASSKYFGVIKNNSGTWGSFIHFKSLKKYIGAFDTEIRAAQARDIESLKDEYQGYHQLNFPELKQKYLSGEITVQKNKRDQQGIKKSKSPSSKYIGVSFDKEANKWRARLILKDKQIHIGRFIKEEEAAIAYNKKVIELYGDSARVNIIQQENSQPTVEQPAG